MNSRPGISHWVRSACAVSILVTILFVRSWYDFSARTEEQELLQLRSEHSALEGMLSVGTNTSPSISNLEPSPDFDPRTWSVGWSVKSKDTIHQSRASWQLKSTDAPSWNVFTQAITHLAQIRGLRIIAVDIRSRGTLTRREIASVEIALEHPTETPPRLRVAGGAVFPGITGPAMPPAVGSDALPNLPSAFPEPQTPVRFATLSVPTPGVPGPVSDNLNP